MTRIMISISSNTGWAEWTYSLFEMEKSYMIYDIVVMLLVLDDYIGTTGLYFIATKISSRLYQ